MLAGTQPSRPADPGTAPVPATCARACASLPRDSRDTLFLLLVIGWVILPQVGNLPLWCSALAGAVLAWRGWLAVKARPLPGTWWLLGLLAVAIVATLFTHRTVLGRDAGVTLVVVLLALKTLELRARRDIFVIFFLGFFTMLTNFFFSQSLPTAAAMLLGLMGLLTALVNAHMPVGKPPLAQAARTAGFMVLLGAPVMAALFLLFPRLAPLWGIPGDAMSGRSGLAATMQVGNIASLALDESIAMRVKFDGPVPPQSDLYFRGPVLSTFDGREWRALPPRRGSRFSMALPGSMAQLQVAGEPVRYEVTLEPNNRPWLLVLDVAATPPVVPGFAAAMSSELLWVTDRPITDLLRYRAESYTTFRYGPLGSAALLPEYLDLPPGFNPRTQQLAERNAARSAARGRRPAGPGRGGAGAAAHRRLQLHPRPRGVRCEQRRRILVRQARRFLRAHRLGLRRADARDGHPGPHRHRLPGRRAQSGRRLLGGAAKRCARLGRGLAARARLGARRSHRGRGAGTHRLVPAPAGAARHRGHGVRQRDAGTGGQPARGLGSREQQLEPMGAELHPEQAARPAEGAGLRIAQLGRPELPVAGPDRHWWRWPAPPGPCGTGASTTPGCGCWSAPAIASAKPGSRCPPPRRRAKSPRLSHGVSEKTAGLWQTGC